MNAIDVHAHVTPERFKVGTDRHGEWLGLGPRDGELQNPGFVKSVAERLRDMDADGVDVQLVSPSAAFYQYHIEVERTARIAREINDGVGEIIDEHPSRFRGLATLPMQDVGLAIAELERTMSRNGFKGAMINDHVVGQTYDDPKFLPFFKAVEAAGAVLFFHQNLGTVVDSRTKKYRLGNGIGNLTDRAITFSTLVFGGVMDACPELKIILGHGGGYTAYGCSRLDKVAGALEGGYPGTGLQPPFNKPADSSFDLQKAPSEYLSRFYYDSCVYDGAVLRFLIDRVGQDQVMLGTDYPAPMVAIDPVAWIENLPDLSDPEKKAILSGNAERLLDVALPALATTGGDAHT